MSQPVNRATYDAALATIEAGNWKVDAENGVIYGYSGRPIGHCRPTGGYPVVGVMLGGRVRSAYQHRIIYESVHGPTPPGMEINHRNGDKADNRIANLEAVTPSGNMRHALRSGLIHLKLTATQASEIRRRHAAGEAAILLARQFGVSRDTIYQISAGQRWRHAA